MNRDAEKALQVPLNAEAERPGLQLQEQLDERVQRGGLGGVEMRFDTRRRSSTSRVVSRTLGSRGTSVARM